MRYQYSVGTNKQLFYVETKYCKSPLGETAFRFYCEKI